MDRCTPRSLSYHRTIAALLAFLALVPSTGCLHLLLASGIYLWEGGNMVPAECDALQQKRVVVVCRPPVSSEYRHAGASSSVAKQVGALLAEHVRGIEVVNPSEVDAWIDERDWNDSKELGRAVDADVVLHIELHHFELFKGQTLFQGNSSVTLSVHDMEDGGKLVWERDLAEVLFPVNSGIPRDKSEKRFQQEYVAVLSTEIAKHFYRHDPNASFAMDALANR